jgi:hypothetical protein
MREAVALADVHLVSVSEDETRFEMGRWMAIV